MIHFGHDRLEQFVTANYESLKPEVLATVRWKLSARHCHPDPTDLEAAYNIAWHALFEQLQGDLDAVTNLPGWLATITYRRAIDDIRRAKPGSSIDGDDADVTRLVCEDDTDAQIANRQKIHQWWMSVRLRLNERERQAVGLCLLHEYSRREASEIMGVDIKRLDKIMVSANKKLGGQTEAIKRDGWCEDQRSLIKAHAFGLHEEGGERHALAVQHLAECSACRALVRQLRGLASVLPAPTLTGGAGAGGGLVGWLGGLFNGGASSGAAAAGAGTAAGGGGITVLGGLGAKTAVLCISTVCAGGVVAVIERAPDEQRRPPTKSASVNQPLDRPTSPNTAPAATRPAASTSSAGSGSSGISAKRTPPSPRSKAAQQEAEFGIESQATSTSITPQQSAAAVPQAPEPTEFGGP